MASAPQATNLPLFYKDLMPLNSRDHIGWSSRSTDLAPWMAGQHAVPVTAEEFVHASRHYPIVFSSAQDPVPLGLMGLNEGVNTFFDDDGKMISPCYVPAYVRRYPFMLAKLQADSDELSLCFDPTTDLLGEFEDGTPLFDGDQPSEVCKATLEFCRSFEEAGFRTGAFVEELKKYELLMDGEVAIQQQGSDDPFIYRGFQMVNQEKLRDLRGDQLRALHQNGMLPLIYAHIFSLEHLTDIFTRQVEQGKGPIPAPAA